MAKVYLADIVYEKTKRMNEQELEAFKTILGQRLPEFITQTVQEAYEAANKPLQRALLEKEAEKPRKQPKNGNSGASEKPGGKKDADDQ